MTSTSPDTDARPAWSDPRWVRDLHLTDGDVDQPSYEVPVGVVGSQPYVNGEPAPFHIFDVEATFGRAEGTEVRLTVPASEVVFEPEARLVFLGGMLVLTPGDAHGMDPAPDFDTLVDPVAHGSSFPYAIGDVEVVTLTIFVRRLIVGGAAPRKVSARPE